jgi:hypothetical protein
MLTAAEPVRDGFCVGHLRLVGRRVDLPGFCRVPGHAERFQRVLYRVMDDFELAALSGLHSEAIRKMMWGLQAQVL